MTFATRKGALERIVEAVALIALSGALGFGGWVVAPAVGVAGAIGAALAALAGAAVAMGALALAGPAGGEFDFYPEPLPVDEASSDLGDDEPDELLLDTPLAAPDSRVVRLFGNDPLPEPGALAAHIDSFLGNARAPRPVPVAAAAPRHDASDALHAALADIRRTLTR